MLRVWLDVGVAPLEPPAIPLPTRTAAAVYVVVKNARTSAAGIRRVEDRGVGKDEFAKRRLVARAAAGRTGASAKPAGVG